MHLHKNIYLLLHFSVFVRKKISFLEGKAVKEIMNKHIQYYAEQKIDLKDEFEKPKRKESA